MAQTTDPADPSDRADPGDRPAQVDPSGVTVVTATHGRHDELLALHASVGRSGCRPRQLVVVAVDDGELITWQPDDGVPVTVVPLSQTPHGIWWSRAKNAGATTALLEGARVVVFAQTGVELDEGALGALERAGQQSDGLWWAEVEGEDSDSPRSEVVAVSVGAWGDLGGFHEEYAGSGFEDADLVRCAQDRGMPVGRADGAVVRRVADAVPRDEDEVARNAELFRARWDTNPPSYGGGW